MTGWSPRAPRSVARLLPADLHGVSFGDYDRDGDLDVFIAGFQADGVTPDLPGPNVM